MSERKQKVVAAATRYEQARSLLESHGLWPDFAVVPVEQLVEMYERFHRLTKLGVATIEEWQKMAAPEAELRHAIFRQSDFGAVFAGQWLPRDVHERTREKLHRDGQTET